MATGNLVVKIRVRGLRRFQAQVWLLKCVAGLTPRWRWLDRLIWAAALWASRSLARSARVVA